MVESKLSKGKLTSSIDASAFFVPPSTIRCPFLLAKFLSSIFCAWTEKIPLHFRQTLSKKNNIRRNRLHIEVEFQVEISTVSRRRRACEVRLKRSCILGKIISFNFEEDCGVIQYVCLCNLLFCLFYL